MMKNVANILTCFRILGSILLLFFPVFSVVFYIIYLLCGLSDMVDGAIARKTNSDTEAGAKMDSIADLIFIAVCLIKILPEINILHRLWIWGVGIAIVKIGNIILGYVYEKQFVSLHTVMNKITGLLLFLLPFTFSFVELKYSSVIVCSAATFSAIQETFYIAARCNIYPEIPSKRH